MKETTTINGLNDLKKYSKTLLKKIKQVASTDQATIVALHGNLGAGKTTLSQLIAKLLGVKETLQSPTFVIQKTYHTTDDVFTQLVHADAYRLDNPKEMKALQFDETVSQPMTLVLVEWAEKIMEIVPSNIIHITIDHVDEDSRSITFEYTN